MRRRIAFFLSRSNHLRNMAPVIDYVTRHCLNRFEVFIFYPGWEISKPALKVDRSYLIELFGDRINLVDLESPSSLLDSIQSLEIEAIVNTSPEVNEIDDDTLHKAITRSRLIGVKWVALPFAHHEAMITSTEPEMILDYWDLVCTMGPRSIEIIESYLSNLSDDMRIAIGKKLAIVGYPEMDGIARLDRGEILAKYGLPDNKPIICVSTAPTWYHHGARTHNPVSAGYEARFRGVDQIHFLAIPCLLTTLRHPVIISYKQYLSKLRLFADRNNAVLIAKTRWKHRDPDYLSDFFDAIFDDVTYFPFTTLELLSVSSFYFGFQSNSVLETVNLGIFSITAHNVPMDVLIPAGKYRDFQRLFLTQKGAIGNTPGVSELLDGTRSSGTRALEKLSNSNLEDHQVDEVEREKLLDRFFSFRGKSSEAFVDALSSLW